MLPGSSSEDETVLDEVSPVDYQFCELLISLLPCALKGTVHQKQVVTNCHVVQNLNMTLLFKKNVSVVLCPYDRSQWVGILFGYRPIHTTKRF